VATRIIGGMKMKDLTNSKQMGLLYLKSLKNPYVVAGAVFLLGAGGYYIYTRKR